MLRLAQWILNRQLLECKLFPKSKWLYRPIAFIYYRRHFNCWRKNEWNNNQCGYLFWYFFYLFSNLKIFVYHSSIRFNDFVIEKREYIKRPSVEFKRKNMENEQIQLHTDVAIEHRAVLYLFLRNCSENERRKRYVIINHYFVCRLHHHKSLWALVLPDGFADCRPHDFTSVLFWRIVHVMRWITSGIETECTATNLHNTIL